MSDAIRGFGDRIRLSVSGFAGGGTRTTEYQNNLYQDDYREETGVDARIDFDLVDGNLIAGPRLGSRYARVTADREREFTLRLEGERQGWGAPGGDAFHYTATTERTEANRFTPYAGLGVGWMPQFSEGALGVQAVFDVGQDNYDGYRIERFRDTTVEVDGDETHGLNLRTGVEVLLESYFWGEDRVGFGFVIGLYGVRSVNPISREGHWEGGEASLGLLTSF